MRRGASLFPGLGRDLISFPSPRHSGRRRLGSSDEGGGSHCAARVDGGYAPCAALSGHSGVHHSPPSHLLGSMSASGTSIRPSERRIWAQSCRGATTGVGRKRNGGFEVSLGDKQTPLLKYRGGRRRSRSRIDIVIGATQNRNWICIANRLALGGNVSGASTLASINAS